MHEAWHSPHIGLQWSAVSFSNNKDHSVIYVPLKIKQKAHHFLQLETVTKLKVI